MSKTIRQTLEWAEAQLSGDEVRLDAEVLLAFCLDKPRSYLVAWPDKDLDSSQVENFAALIDQRVQGKPVAYITGEQEFWSLPLMVTSDTLIPRPETEHLVEFLLEVLPESGLSVVDAGTGTGAIGLALAHERKDWQVSACDFSEAALHVASSNAEKLGVQVSFFQSDWLSGLPESSLDVVVSNPPYIEAGDPHLSDLGYEPLSALVAQDSGLSDIRTICQQAFMVLKLGGLLCIEHGYDQAQAVQEIFRKAGFSAVHCEKDYSGNDRFTHGIKS